MKLCYAKRLYAKWSPPFNSTWNYKGILTTLREIKMKVKLHFRLIKKKTLEHMGKEESKITLKIIHTLINDCGLFNADFILCLFLLFCRFVSFNPFQLSEPKPKR